MPTWRPVPDFPMYEVSDTGLVRSHHRTRRGKRGGLLALYPQKGRYGTPRYTVKLCDGQGVRKTHDVARLVLETFVGPAPDGMECCHTDGDSLNNELSNLRWDTHHANMQDAVRHGTMGRPPELTEEQAKAVYLAEDTHKAIAERFGISQGHVSEIKSRKKLARWTEGLGEPGKSRKLRANCRLTREQMLSIHHEATALSAPTAVDLAKKYGVSVSVIKRLRKGQFPKSMRFREQT